MIVWGGIDGEFLDTGGRYDPATDTWQVTTLARAFAALVPRRGLDRERDADLAAVPTSTATIIATTAGATTSGRMDAHQHHRRAHPRSQCAAVWTGSEIIWAATDGGIELNDGAKYNPRRTPDADSSDSGLAAHGTGVCLDRDRDDCLRRDQVHRRIALLRRRRPLRSSDRFLDALPPPAAPLPHWPHRGMTGSRMVVWGGYEVPSRVA